MDTARVTPSTIGNDQNRILAMSSLRNASSIMKAKAAAPNANAAPTDSAPEAAPMIVASEPAAAANSKHQRDSAARN